jgi:hypothetical protein
MHRHILTKAANGIFAAAAVAGCSTRTPIFPLAECGTDCTGTRNTAAEAADLHVFTDDDIASFSMI